RQAHPRPSSGRTGSGRSGLRSMRSRPWTPQSAKSSTSSWNAASARAARRRISETMRDGRSSRIRPPLRAPARTTSPPLNGGEEPPAAAGSDNKILASARWAKEMPATAQEVARTAGVGEKGGQTRSRRKAGTTKRARRLRQAGNEAEALLWLELKRSRLG